jgi:hypothetical protein
MATIPSVDTGEPVAAVPDAPVRLCSDDVVTEDDIPVDDMLSEKQHRLLTEPFIVRGSRAGSFWQRPTLGCFTPSASRRWCRTCC